MASESRKSMVHGILLIALFSCAAFYRFAFGFILVICFNSLNLLPAKVVDGINSFDTFLLTMAMTALGAETNFAKFKQAGAKPFLLAAILFVWLMGGGWLMSKYLVPLL